MKFYLSHPIRGSKGKDATNVDMQKNNEKAILIANLIRNAFPTIEIHVPAEMEDFVIPAYRKGYITEEQILDVDCTIIDGCEGVLVYIPEGDELQGGCKIEYDYAMAHKKPVFVFADVGDVINWLAEYIVRV